MKCLPLHTEPGPASRSWEHHAAWNPMFTPQPSLHGLHSRHDQAYADSAAKLVRHPARHCFQTPCPHSLAALQEELTITHVSTAGISMALHHMTRPHSFGLRCRQDRCHADSAAVRAPGAPADVREAGGDHGAVRRGPLGADRVWGVSAHVSQPAAGPQRGQFKILTLVLHLREQVESGHFPCISCTQPAKSARPDGMLLGLHGCHLTACSQDCKAVSSGLRLIRSCTAGAHVWSGRSCAQPP